MSIWDIPARQFLVCGYKYFRLSFRQQHIFPACVSQDNRCECQDPALIGTSSDIECLYDAIPVIVWLNRIDYRFRCFDIKRSQVKVHKSSIIINGISSY